MLFERPKNLSKLGLAQPFSLIQLHIDTDTSRWLDNPTAVSDPILARLRNPEIEPGAEVF